MKSLHALATLALGAALAGCAPTAVVGTGALLTRSVMQERSTLDGLSDTEIELGVQTRLGNHSGELFRDVLVDVTEGEVVLTGTVPRPDDKIAAAKAAWATPGVVAVSEALEVAEDSGPRAYWQDVAIANRLRYDLLTDGEISSVNYTVTVVDRTVHLTGIARSERELERAVARARQVPGVDRVVSHVRLIDDPARIERLVSRS